MLINTETLLCKIYMFKDFKQLAYLQETFGPIFNDLYQARKVSSHVFVLLGVSILSFSSIFDPTVWYFFSIRYLV
jgi:hypothetical protein